MVSEELHISLSLLFSCVLGELFNEAPRPQAIQNMFELRQVENLLRLFKAHFSFHFLKPGIF